MLSKYSRILFSRRKFVYILSCALSILIFLKYAKKYSKLKKFVLVQFILQLYSSIIAISSSLLRRTCSMVECVSCYQSIRSTFSIFSLYYTSYVMTVRLKPSAFLPSKAHKCYQRESFAYRDIVTDQRKQNTTDVTNVAFRMIPRSIKHKADKWIVCLVVLSWGVSRKTRGSCDGG